MPKKRITQDDALQYKQIASILARDIDLLQEACEGVQGIRASFIKDQVDFIATKKEEVVKDSAVRKARYCEYQSLRLGEEERADNNIPVSPADVIFNDIIDGLTILFASW